jgi:5'-phosphate synthase pdxT subunit
LDSFETTLSVDGLGEVPAVFIRAPAIKRVGPTVEILGRLGAEPVFVKEGAILGATFHPELTEDLRIHEFFVNLCRKE